MPVLSTDWLRPDWPAPAHVHALCTTRWPGASLAPYDGLNLGSHVGDDPWAVQANRRLLQDALGSITPGAQAVFLQQVHGTQVHSLDKQTPPDTCADASIATARGAVCTIMVADCLPVLFTNRQGSVVAAAHAGWRGLAGVQDQGVLETTLRRFMDQTHAQQALAAIEKEACQPPAAMTAADVLAWLGPCIGPQAFEVGQEVQAAFCARDGGAAAHFQALGGGKYLADLAALARQRLHALGVTQVYGNDSSAPWCTVGNPSRFFSHRRSSAAGGGSGRFAVCIWRG